MQSHRRISLLVLDEVNELGHDVEVELGPAVLRVVELLNDGHRWIRAWEKESVLVVNFLNVWNGRTTMSLTGANRVHLDAQTIYRSVIEGLFRLKNNWGDSLAILALR